MWLRSCSDSRSVDHGRTSGDCLRGRPPRTRSGRLDAGSSLPRGCNKREKWTGDAAIVPHVSIDQRAIRGGGSSPGDQRFRNAAGQNEQGATSRFRKAVPAFAHEIMSLLKVHKSCEPLISTLSRKG